MTTVEGHRYIDTISKNDRAIEYFMTHKISRRFEIVSITNCSRLANNWKQFASFVLSSFQLHNKMCSRFMDYSCRLSTLQAKQLVHTTLGDFQIAFDRLHLWRFGFFFCACLLLTILQNCKQNCIHVGTKRMSANAVSTTVFFLRGYFYSFV